ncbi:ABC transporter ATP-binding protein [Bacteriovorax stolpii]|uniref:Macrolide ABC transporter ATP-binding protein n=1 Tax=Bacteriovorax stolpii TaxID=960 RepID=A0A2K9NQV2_BACTC|nr:ABC transporter ATP-binding protein [Bacteriovorax stolpii]AUN97881.1 macrolide ABC transporter ATP-binding protein [Bacteriovorax stolpii]QDK42133.1 ABC transporter ATP-binding protein [Bacteriovorax stolpii]TDP51712.1 putative ABC transport system ATP-binding protein [Bacteriovorax stolpii]
MEKFSDAVLRFQNIHKIFSSDGVNFTALEKINFTIHKGEFIGLSGKSGSGKTSLLNVAGLIDPPTKGDLFIKNTNIKDLKDHELSLIRAQEIGFIFQTFNLLPLLSALENVEYPLMLLNIPEAERLERAHQALKRVGLEGFTHRRPGQLSGGQRQRVAIARAIVKSPTLILADEPTANLDTKTSEEVFDLLMGLQQDMKVTVMLCSHDPDLIAKTQRQIKISDGHIISDSLVGGA